jgi:hypothetical protein
MALMENAMLREEIAATHLIQDEDSVWPVLSRDRQSARDASLPVVDAVLSFRSEAAAPDVPSAVGAMLAMAYLALIGALALATAGPGPSRMAVVIAGIFVAIFFTVPWCIFKQEVTLTQRTAMSHFLAQGMQTYTGPCTGKAALVQMFIVPALLTFGVLLIAAEIVLLG